MEKSKILWIAVILNLFISQSISDQQICRRSDNCQCFNNSDHYEYQCSENQKEEEEEVILHVYPDSLIKIDCSNVEVLNKQKLPSVKFEDIEKLQIRYCPLPENGLKEIVQHFGMKNLDMLSFEFGVFDDFKLETEKFINLPNVTVLRLRGNDLKSIGDNFFNNFPQLVSLELDRNQLDIQGRTFAALARLKFLSLSDNKIEYIPNDFFYGLEKLEKLNLWKNNIEKLNELDFKKLSNLKSLELAYNKIEIIENTSFFGLNHLVNISLRSNSLKTLSKITFQSNPLLEQIELSGNPGLKLTEDVFANFRFLKIVDLGSTKLQNIPKDLFKNSQALESISLEKNEIVVLPQDIFQDLKNLRELSLSYNKIRFLDDNIFGSLMNLENLYLQHNNLREITINLLKHLTKLKELDLSYNDILNIHLDAFSRTKNLVKLSLSHNQYNYQDVSIFPVSPFNKCGNLQEIDLSHNNIQDFPEDLMLLTSMKTIDLSWNNIKSLRVNALWKVTISELKIDLEHNQISRLNFEGVEVTALQQPDLDAYHNVGASAVINISENPIICDCFAIDFVRYIQDEIYPGVKTAIFFLYDNVKCASPEIFEHISIEEITPAMLSCPLEDVIENFTCTNSDRCVCAWRPFDYSLIVDCDNKNLTSIPEIYQPMKLIFNQTEVHLEGNYLTKGPAADSVGFENVSKLYLGSNKIDEIEWIPPRLKILHLHDNKLEKIHHQVLEQLNSTQIQNISLNGNLWKCDCAAANLTNFLRQHVHQIDTSQIFCDRSNKLLINLNDKDLCPHNSFLLASITSLIFLLCILTSVAAFYYKFQQEIKVWMYAHNICLFLIEEEELDKDKIYDVFVSYSHKDEDFVLENLVAVLENGPKPYKLCVHFRNWIPGEFISTQVTSSVRDSRRTMVILSSNFLESVWGKMEFRTAHSEAMREGRARVIIVLIGDINIDSLDDELRAYMKTNTYIKWGDPWFWDKLKYALPHSKLDRVDIQSQKHANMMKYIDDKFSLVKGKTSSENSSTTSISIKNGKKLDVELDIDEDAIIKHEII